ncbi:hypothetical protein C0J52_04691 [Blattella germanica]|nr:hypothetical protein C0J52_04691 [Blattella germanica]
MRKPPNLVCHPPYRLETCTPSDFPGRSMLWERCRSETCSSQMAILKPYGLLTRKGHTSRRGE